MATDEVVESGEVVAVDVAAGADDPAPRDEANRPTPARPVAAGAGPFAARPGLPPRRIRAGLWRAGLAAEALLEAADGEAALIRRLARGEIGAWRAEARAAGLATGLAEGRARAAALVLETERRRDEALRQADALVLELAVALARRLAGEAIRAEPAALVGAVEEALRAARGRRRAVVRLDPAGAVALRAEGGRMAAAAAPAAVELVPDPALQPGDVVVESECGLVDGRLEVRLAALRRAVEGLA